MSPGSVLCLPRSCTIYCVQQNETFFTLAKNFASYGLTKASFSGWNAAIDNDCSNFVVGDAYCLDSPAGKCAPSTIPGMQLPQATFATASVLPTAPSSTSKPSSTAAPSPTPSGIVSTCTTYAKSYSGSSCQGFATNNNVSLACLYAWNSIFGSHGENCTTQFQANTYYCTAVSGPKPAPGPVQTGVVDTCVQYGLTNTGASCSAFATRMNITLAQLYAWNTVLGTDGANCQSKFLSNEYYCIAVASAPADPYQPRQDGTISTCNKFTKSNPDGYCTAFAPNNGISLAQLYAWNPVLGYQGQYCSTKFLGSEYYCTGVSGPLPAPGAVQAGVIDTCTKYAKSNADGSCQYFPGNQNITATQLYTWNAVLGNSGQYCSTKFLGNEYYCVAVAG
ncbi:hypothetical protein LTR95_005702 [Oleoguttula sp. CCFEE 5521]